MTEYKIIADSSCELPEQYKTDERIKLVPFRLEIDGVPLRDTSDLNTKSLLEKIVDSKAFINSACPSPDVIYNCIAEGNEKRIYIITSASKLSGCYISAMIAKKLYEDARGDKEIFVIDSKSISGAESRLALLAMELEEQGIEAEEIKKNLTSCRDRMRTVIIMSDLEAVYKNIKLDKIKDIISKAGRVKPVLVGSEDVIREEDSKLCLKESFSQLVDNLVNTLKDASEQTRVFITHCNNLIEAEKLRDMIMEKTGLKNIFIMSASGFNSLLADNGGLIVSFD